MKTSRKLASTVPAIAVLCLATAVPASASDFNSCTGRACAGVYGYRYASIGGGMFEIWIDNMVVTDLRKDDGYTPYIKINFTGNVPSANFFWGTDNGQTEYLGEEYMYDVKDVWFQTCQRNDNTSTVSCKQMSLQPRLVEHGSGG